MFVAVSRYTAPDDAVDRHRDAHLEWLCERYREGRIMTSGPRVPRIGGVLVLRAAGRDALDAVLATDPYVVAGVAAYEVLAYEQTPAPRRSVAFDRFAMEPDLPDDRVDI